MVRKLLNDYELGFLEAGLDFEGCLGLYKNKSGYFYMIVVIVVKNKPILEKVKEICGGEGFVMPVAYKSDRNYWRYRIHIRVLRWILPQIELTIKEEQRQLIMESFEYMNRPNHSLSYNPEHMQELERIYLKMKKLNSGKGKKHS